MTAAGIVLIIWAIIGFVLGSVMFGDIGIAAFIGAIGSLIAGMGLLAGASRIRRLTNQRAVSTPTHVTDV